MLDPQDIKNLTEYQLEVFKDVFMTKEDGQKLESKIDNMQTSVDALAKSVNIHSEEILTLNKRTKEVENWTDKAAPKLDIKFEH